jgi:hypothetical protein
MDQSCGSRGKAPTLQVQNPEFKPQSYQKKENTYVQHMSIHMHTYVSP